MIVQTERVADWFYLCARNEWTDREQLPDDTLSLGCAAGLLCELIMESPRQMYVRPGYPPEFRQMYVKPGCPPEFVEYWRNGGPPYDSTAHTTLDRLVLYPVRERPLSEWLAFLASDARDDVERRLAMFGFLEWIPTGIIRKRLVAELREGVKLDRLRPLTTVQRLFPRTEHDPTPSGDVVAVAALLDTVGLGEQVWGPRRLDSARRYLAHDLARFPDIREVIAQFHTCIAKKAALTV